MQYATNIRIRRTGNVISVKIQGLDSLPAGGFTDICTLPSDYAPSENFGYDVLVGTDNTGSSLRTIRVRLETNGQLMLYNYGAVMTNLNAEISVIFLG